MANQLKNFFQDFLNWLISKVIKTHSQAIPKSNTEPLKDFFNDDHYINFSMLIYEDLKKVFLIKEVIDKDFCLIYNKDSLAKALSFIFLKDFDYLVLVNENEEFLCLIDSIDILREIPPPILSIPLKFRSNDPNPPKEVSNFLSTLLNKRVDEVFSLESLPQYFYESDDRLSRALEELAKPYSLNTSQRTVPILYENKTVAGTVSSKEILRYIYERNHKDPFFKTSIKKVFPQKFSRQNSYFLLPEDTLAYAYLAVEYIPRQSILVCNSQSELLGKISRRKIATMYHPMYQYLANISISEVLEPVPISSCIEAKQSLEEVINLLLSTGVDNSILVSDKTVNPEVLKLDTELYTNLDKCFWQQIIAPVNDGTTTTQFEL